MEDLLMAGDQLGTSSVEHNGSLVNFADYSDFSNLLVDIFVDPGCDGIFELSVWVN